MLHNRIEKLFDYKCQAYTVNAQAIKSYLIGFGFRERKIQVIRNIFNFPKPNTPKIKELKKKYAGKKIVLTVAHFRPQKDYETNLNVCKQVFQKRPDVQFVYAGDGPLLGRIKKMAKAMGLEKQVVFLGRTDAIPELLNIADVFFLPTLYEGQSNAVVEALHYGCPVVTTDIPENKECSDAAYFCAPGDALAMSKAIKRVLEGKLPKTGRDISSEDVAGQYVNLYKKFA